MTRHFLISIIVGAAVATLALTAACAIAHADPVHVDASTRASAIATTAPPIVNRDVSPPNIAPATPAPDPGQLWRRGEYLAAGIVGVFLLLGVLVKVDRRRVLWWTGGLVALGGCIDLVANGQTPNLGMLVGAGAAFVGVLLRSPLPVPAPIAIAPRLPESGHAAGPLLVILASVGIVAGAGVMWSCSHPVVRATTSAAVDCTIAAVQSDVDRLGATLEATIRAATSPDGHVDVGAIQSELVRIGLRDSGCLAAEVFARLLQGSPVARVAPGGYDPRAGLRDAWERLRAVSFAGRTFVTASGLVI